MSLRNSGIKLNSKNPKKGKEERNIMTVMFGQPVIKLKEKIRIKGKIHRRYKKARTPYQYLMESKEIDIQTKQELKNIYDNLNPAELKRMIDKKLNLLYEAYKTKGNRNMVEPVAKRLKPISVSFLTAQRNPFRCHS